MMDYQKTIGISLNMQNNLSYLQYILGTKDLTDVIKNSLEISKVLLNLVLEGNQIIIENKDGVRKELAITGLREW
jgi:hypothetical protein